MAEHEWALINRVCSPGREMGPGKRRDDVASAFHEQVLRDIAEFEAVADRKDFTSPPRSVRSCFLLSGTSNKF